MRNTIRRRVLGIVTMTVGLFMVSGLVYAHHAHQPTADYSKLVGVTGVVTRHQFTNPHILLHVQATLENGTTEDWVGYGSSPAHEARLGNSARLYAAGEDKVTMYGFPNKDGRKFMIWVRIVRANGEDVPIYQTETNDLLAFYKVKGVTAFNQLPESEKRYIGGKAYQAKKNHPG